VDDLEEVMANIATTFPGLMNLDRMDAMTVEELMRWHDKAVKRNETS
jgi:hypothetical protein